MKHSVPTCSMQRVINFTGKAEPALVVV